MLKRTTVIPFHDKISHTFFVEYDECYNYPDCFSRLLSHYFDNETMTCHEWAYTVCYLAKMKLTVI